MRYDRKRINLREKILSELTKITDLVKKYKSGEIGFDEVIRCVPFLEWGSRHEEADGEIWWDGENTVGDVDILWYENVINDDERKAIMDAIT